MAKSTDDVQGTSADIPIPDTTDTIPLRDSDDRQADDTADNAAGIEGPRGPRPERRNGPTVLSGYSDSTVPRAPCSP